MPNTVLELLQAVKRRINTPSKWIRDNIPTGAAIRAKGGLTYVHLDDPEANCFTLLGSLLLSLKIASDYASAKALHDTLCGRIHEEISLITKMPKGVRAVDITKFNMLHSHRHIMAMLDSVEYKLRSGVTNITHIYTLLLQILTNEEAFSNTGLAFDDFMHPCAIESATTFSLMGALLKTTSRQDLIALALQGLEHTLRLWEIEESIGDYAAKATHLDTLILIEQTLYLLKLPTEEEL